MNHLRVVSVLFAVISGFCWQQTFAQSADALQRLQDRAEIEELVVRYIASLDGLDAEGLASVFTEDAVYETPIATYEGRDAIRGIVTDLQEASAGNDVPEGVNPLGLYHVMSNSSIELVSDVEARHTSYAQTVRAGEDGQFNVGFMGRYEDIIVKRDGRWQILERKLVTFVR